MVTVGPGEVSTMSYPSPVTPLYNTNFGDYASLDMNHQSGPTGPPGLPLFHTVGPKHDKPVPHSNSHYINQNPFLVSPLPSVTAGTAAPLYNYNPLQQSTSKAQEYNPIAR